MAEYQIFKGKPIVRKGNIIYFGKTDQKYQKFNAEWFVRSY